MIERVSDSLYFLHFIFLAIFIGIVVLKEVNAFWFKKFIQLGWSTDYLKLVFTSPKKDRSFINLLLFLSTIIISLSYQFIHQALNENAIVFNLKSSLFTLSYILGFLLFKYLIQKSIAYLFNVKKVLNNYVELKLNLFCYFGLLMFVPLLLLVYTELNSLFIVIIYGVFVGFYILKIAQFLLKSRSLIARHLFYFILYICSLEIIPILFIIRYLK
ncbi:DUF4271 domain-containing protein [Psychroflexus salis]|uniref:DUF4271 domain-containing protein n=1 Tax=Psychroflexus salis TaxID=1526574 RepID=A0A917A0B0_9FLAO|nr:DUF4271 domain-containing protein [Psychroflexus salis]